MKIKKTMRKAQTLFLFIISLLILNGCTGEPEAIFSVDSNEYQTEEEIQFSNESLNSKSYTWNFGDGVSSTSVNPIHSYQYTGNYTISLYAVNNDQESETTKTLTIVPNFEPTIYEGERVDDLIVYDEWSFVERLLGTDTSSVTMLLDDIYYHAVYYPEYGLELIFPSHESTLVDDDVVYWIYANFENEGITYKGIDFNNTIDDVYMAYGSPLDTQNSGYSYGYWYDHLGIDFYEYTDDNGNFSGLVDEMCIYEPTAAISEKSASIHNFPIKKFARQYQSRLRR